MILRLVDNDIAESLDKDNVEETMDSFLFQMMIAE